MPPRRGSVEGNLSETEASLEDRTMSGSVCGILEQLSDLNNQSEARKHTTSATASLNDRWAWCPHVPGSEPVKVSKGSKCCAQQADQANTGLQNLFVMFI